MADENDLCASLLVEDMIGFSFDPKAKNIKRSSLHMSLNRCLSIILNSGIPGCYKTIGIPKSTFWGWTKGTVIPPLASLIILCSNMGVKLEQMYINEFSDGGLKFGQTIKYYKELHKQHDHVAIKDYLLEVIDRRLPLSLSEVALKIGCDRKILTQKFPKECELIKDAFVCERIKQRQKRLEHKSKQLQDVFERLINLNIYPSRRKIEEELGSGFLKEQSLQVKWKQLKNKHLL